MRVLKPGGVLVICDAGKGPWPHGMLGWIWMNTVVQVAARVVLRTWDHPFRWLARTYTHYGTNGYYRRMLSEVGYEQVQWTVDVALPPRPLGSRRQSLTISTEERREIILEFAGLLLIGFNATHHTSSHTEEQGDHQCVHADHADHQHQACDLEWGRAQSLIPRPEGLHAEWGFRRRWRDGDRCWLYDRIRSPRRHARCS